MKHIHHAFIMGVAIVVGSFVIANGIEKAGLNQRYAMNAQGNMIIDQKTGTIYAPLKQGYSYTMEQTLRWNPFFLFDPVSGQQVP